MDEDKYVDIEDTVWFKNMQEYTKKHWFRTGLRRIMHIIIGNLFWRPINYIKNKGKINVNE